MTAEEGPERNFLLSSCIRHYKSFFASTTACAMALRTVKLRQKLRLRNVCILLFFLLFALVAGHAEVPIPGQAQLEAVVTPPTYEHALENATHLGLIVLILLSLIMRRLSAEDSAAQTQTTRQNSENGRSAPNRCSIF
jgi:hypothetical protein